MTNQLSNKLDSIFKNILIASNEEPDISVTDLISPSGILDLNFEADNKTLSCSDNTTFKASIISVVETENAATSEKIQTGNLISDSIEIKWDELLTTSSSTIDANVRKLIQILESPGTSVDTKYKILDYISKESKNDPNSFHATVPGLLVNFTENLLKKFCDIFLKNDKNLAKEEFILLKPSLELLIPCAKMPIQTINSTFLVQSDFLYNLLQVISLCCNNMTRTLKKLSTLTKGKTLSCISSPLSSVSIRTAFEMCFKIRWKHLTTKLQGSQVIIFDKVDSSFDRNINEEMVKIQPYVDGIYSYYNAELGIEADKQNIKVVRLLSPKHSLAYLGPDWQELLADISHKVHQLVKDETAAAGKISKIKKGDIVGFCSNEARFETEALIMMTYLRAEVLSVIGDQAMLWAMDVGLLTYSCTEKLCLIQDETLLSLKPVVSVAVIKGPICEYDDKFLELALRLLKDILMPTAQQGKHMFLSETGEDILVLAEHPNIQVRIHILDIILHLANHCQEVRSFLEKQKFDLYLAGKLEQYVHCYASEIWSNKVLLKIEMIIITKIFITFFEDKTSLQTWLGKEKTLKALRMLLEETDIQPTYIFRNCLRNLTGKISASPQPSDRGEHHGENWKDPQKQGYFRQWSQKQEFHKNYSKNEYSRGEYIEIDTKVGRNNMEDKKETYLPNDKGNEKDIPVMDLSKKKMLLETEKERRKGYYQSYDESLKMFMEHGNDTVEEDEEEKSLSGPVDYLIRGSTVDVKCDQTHHLMEEKEVHDLQEMKLAQIVCGLLNNNVESYLYFGISQDSVVEGMLLTRDNRDVFRNGLDRTMSKSLLPEVQLSAYDIIFIPVVRPGDKVIALAKKALYVIEIRIRPLRHMVYALHQCRKCYVRRDTDTLESTITQKKNYMIEMEERALDEATESIKSISKSYISILAEFINKYLSKEKIINESDQ